MDHNAYYSDSQYQDNKFDIMESENSYSIYDEDFVEHQNETNGDALLISLVRDHPYLYNKELTDFKCSIKRQNAWEEIGSILNMSAEECQSRWTRMRERYTREKKQRQEETTTGSGVAKRKIFEFFENMQFLEPFVKRRRTMTNIKIAPPPGKYCNLQKNFGSQVKKGIISSTVTTLKEKQSFIDTDSTCTAQNIRYFGLHSGKENTSSMTTVTLEQSLIDTDSACTSQNVRHFVSQSGNEITSPTTALKQSSIDTNSSCTVQTIRKSFDTYDEKDTSNTDIINNTNTIRNIEALSSVQQLRDSSSGIHSNISDTSSTSALRASDYVQNKSFTGQRMKVKGKSQQDVLQSTISKVSSILENRYSSTSSSSSSLKSEIEEDLAFCQLILSSYKYVPM